MEAANKLTVTVISVLIIPLKQIQFQT